VETSVNALASVLQRAAGVETPLDYAPARAGEIARSALEVRKAQSVLGWAPTVSVDEGLTETFRWFAAYRAEVGA
jgi:UDP-glucose 4-epimerase